jgi:hypothetical protein
MRSTAHINHHPIIYHKETIMALMYLHLRPSSRQDQPFDDMDDDFIMAVDTGGKSAPLSLPHDGGTLDDTIMDTYNRLGLA